MNLFHIANTNFEWELGEKKRISFPENLGTHPIFLQLQFLPFWYGDSHDIVGVTHLPTQDFWESFERLKITPPKLCLIGDVAHLQNIHLETWGASRAVADWAQRHHFNYVIPNWETVCTINSKAFSFLHSPKLPKAMLLENAQQARHWLDSFSGNKVLKTCFGASGRGHLIIDEKFPCDEKKIAQFMEREWSLKRPIIAEPWVDRLLDFSTQWEISKEKSIIFIGSTICKNDPKGVYRENHVGEDLLLFGKFLPHLEKHKLIALEILSQIASRGYFGNVGIDAMIYKSENEIHLHPIVEINARKTMGWAALQILKKHFPGKTLAFKFLSAHDKGILPQGVIKSDNTTLSFRRQLLIENDLQLMVVRDKNEGNGTVV